MKKDKSVGNILEFPEKIFIGDITGQRVCVKIYGPESLENQLAVVTHYLHNQNTHAEDTYKEDGIAEIKHLVQYFFPDLVNPDQVAEDARQYGLFRHVFDIPYPVPENPRFTFIDLFAGIGGIRLGFDRAFKDDIETVFVSEWDEKAQETYRANFTDSFGIAGDITKIPESEIPTFDICLAGFPCQAFSMAG